MSAGTFRRSRYEDDNANVYPCRVQPETLAAVIDGNDNSATTSAVTSDVSASMTSSRRKYGVQARRIRLALKEGSTPPTDYSGQPVTIPVLQQSVFNDAAKDSDVSYLGTTWTLVSKLPEYLN